MPDLARDGSRWKASFQNYHCSRMPLCVFWPADRRIPSWHLWPTIRISSTWPSCNCFVVKRHLHQKQYGVWVDTYLLPLSTGSLDHETMSISSMKEMYIQSCSYSESRFAWKIPTSWWCRTNSEVRRSLWSCRFPNSQYNLVPLNRRLHRCRHKHSPDQFDVFMCLDL